MLITLRIWFWIFIDQSVWCTTGCKVSILRQKRHCIRLAKAKEKEQLTLEKILHQYGERKNKMEYVEIAQSVTLFILVMCNISKSTKISKLEKWREERSSGFKDYSRN